MAPGTRRGTFGHRLFAVPLPSSAIDSEPPARLQTYIDELGLLAHAETADDLAAIWPRLCEAINITPYAMPPVEQVHAMWPFVAAGIREQAITATEYLSSGFSKAATTVVTEAATTISETSASFLDRLLKMF